MIWYVAFVAIVNLALGYGVAVFLGAGRRHPAPSQDEDIDQSLSASALLSDPIVDESSLAEPGTDFTPEPQPTPTVAAAENSPASEAPIAPADVDLTTGLTTREQIEKQLADMTMAHADLQPMTVALVEIAQAADGADGVEDRLLRGIADTVRETMSEMQTAGRYSDQQFLLLLPRDDLQHATHRAEQVRQRVEATQFVADGHPIQTTVTCALAQVAASHTAENLLEFLAETLEEAKRYGGNRTFMHDGTSPAPVVPPELNVAPQTCAI